MEEPNEIGFTVREDPVVPERVLVKLQLPAVCDLPMVTKLRPAKRNANVFIHID